MQYLIRKFRHVRRLRLRQSLLRFRFSCSLLFGLFLRRLCSLFFGLFLRRLAGFLPHSSELVGGAGGVGGAVGWTGCRTTTRIISRDSIIYFRKRREKQGKTAGAQSLYGKLN